MKRLLLLISGALLVVNAASASVIVNLVGVAPSGPTNFTWTYNFTLSTDQNFIGNDYSEIIDFSAPAAIVSTTWNGAALSAGNVAITKVATGPGTPVPGNSDLASLMNIVVTDTGVTILGSSVSGAVGDLGQLVVVSTLGSVSKSGGNFTGTFSSLAQKASDGSPTFNQGYIPTPAATPEPTTMCLMGFGLLGLGWIGRRSARRRA